MAYLELGDEQLDMYQVQEKLSPYDNRNFMTEAIIGLLILLVLMISLLKFIKNILLEFTYDT
jgi:hypothetical protein